jgi:2-C-methyl-D-erythritol 4-phosphate cytidylyltransferase
MEVWAIVLAAGASQRFGGAQAKQWARIGGVRLVDRAVAAATAACDSVVVVLPADVAWTGTEIQTVVGGTTRAASVRAGLAAVPDTADIVVVHDAAHPLATAALFERVITAVRAGANGAVPVTAVTETVVRVDGPQLAPVVNASLGLAQMPHAFAAPVLRAAHRTNPDARDDASLLIALGHHVVAVPGDPANLHVTTHDDLDLAHRIARPELNG